MAEHNSSPGGFSLPRKSQIQSRLMALPGELRLKILRYLLKDLDAFRAMSSDNIQSWIDAPSLSKVNLSTQILRTCQQLYTEGTDVLHSDNTVELHFSMETTKSKFQNHRAPFQRHDLQFGMFSGGFSAFMSQYSAAVDVSPAAVFQDWTFKREALRWKDMQISNDLRARIVTRLKWQMLLVSKIQKLRVRICYTAQVDVSLACQFLRQICYGKSVELELSLKNDIKHTVSEVEAIRACRGLRCHEIKFLGVSDDVNNGLIISEVRSKILGDDKQITNLPSCRERIHRKLASDRTLLSFHLKQNTEQLEDDGELLPFFNAMDKAVFESDDATFHIQKRNILAFLKGVVSKAMSAVEKQILEDLYESDSE